MESRKVEIAVGVFVALGVAALMMLALRVSNLTEFTGGNSYQVTVHFDDIGGLKVRAPVRMGGVLVGRVSGIGYDAERFQAKVTLSIESGYDQIPTDTVARIFTAGLLGEQYVSLEPGGGVDTMLKEGSEISMSESALVLEKIVGHLVTNLGSGGGDK